MQPPSESGFVQLRLPGKQLEHVQQVVAYCYSTTVPAECDAVALLQIADFPTSSPLYSPAFCPFPLSPLSYTTSTTDVLQPWERHIFSNVKRECPEHTHVCEYA
jgi:hypothetical protein